MQTSSPRPSLLFSHFLEYTTAKDNLGSSFLLVDWLAEKKFNFAFKLSKQLEQGFLVEHDLSNVTDMDLVKFGLKGIFAYDPELFPGFSNQTLLVENNIFIPSSFFSSLIENPSRQNLDSYWAKVEPVFKQALLGDLPSCSGPVAFEVFRSAGKSMVYGKITQSQDILSVNSYLDFLDKQAEFPPSLEGLWDSVKYFAQQLRFCQSLGQTNAIQKKIMVAIDTAIPRDFSLDKKQVTLLLFARWMQTVDHKLEKINLSTRKKNDLAKSTLGLFVALAETNGPNCFENWSHVYARFLKNFLLLDDVDYDNAGDATDSNLMAVKSMVGDVVYGYRTRGFLINMLSNISACVEGNVNDQDFLAVLALSKIKELPAQASNYLPEIIGSGEGFLSWLSLGPEEQQLQNFAELWLKNRSDQFLLSVARSVRQFIPEKTNGILRPSKEVLSNVRRLYSTTGFEPSTADYLAFTKWLFLDSSNDEAGELILSRIDFIDVLIDNKILDVKKIRDAVLSLKVNYVPLPSPKVVEIGFLSQKEEKTNVQSDLEQALDYLVTKYPPNQEVQSCAPKLILVK